jgi:rod shape determining protein RodA
MGRNENSIFYGVDRVTLLVYVILVFMGWLNIYAAVYNEEHQNIFDTTQTYGMQLISVGKILDCPILQDISPTYL